MYRLPFLKFFSESCKKDSAIIEDIRKKMKERAFIPAKLQIKGLRFISVKRSEGCPQIPVTETEVLTASKRVIRKAVKKVLKKKESVFLCTRYWIKTKASKKIPGRIPAKIKWIINAVGKENENLSFSTSGIK